MPQIKDIVQKRPEKKFIKKNYRPWDLTGSTNDQPIAPQEQSLEMPHTVASPEVDFASISPFPKTVNLAEEPLIVKQPNQDPINYTNLIENNLGIKSITSASSLDNKLDTNSITIKKQIDTDLVTLQKQLGSELDNDLGNIREQLDNELNPNSLTNRLTQLSGIQRKILEFVVDICLAKSSLETGPIQTAIITQYVNTTYGSTKISINRLISKGFLSRGQGKTARGGYINLQISEEIKSAVLEQRRKSAIHIDPISLLLSVREKMNTPQDNQQQIDNNTSLYSSNYINKNNTTDLPLEWKNIDIEPLSDIGFSITQLKQLVNKNNPEVVQESIKHFAYGRHNNPKFKTYSEPLNVLMGVLRKGLKWNEINYISPQEQALKQLIEEKRDRKEKQEKMVKELAELEFPEWRKNLSEEELKSIVPKGFLNMNLAEPTLRVHFLEKVLTPRLIENGIIK